MRIFLQYILPLLLPLMVFLAYAWLTRHKRQEDGKSWYEDGPWFWLVVAGFVLMVGGLVATALMTGAEPGTDYQAPRWEGGKVVPGKFE